MIFRGIWTPLWIRTWIQSKEFQYASIVFLSVVSIISQTKDFCCCPMQTLKRDDVLKKAIESSLSLPVKYFTDRSKAVLLSWIFYVFVPSCVCYVFVCVCLYVLCGHLLGKGWPLGSRLWCLTVSFVTFPLVSWVRCGTWLYRFLIFATLLSLLFVKIWIRFESVITIC